MNNGPKSTDGSPAHLSEAATMAEPPSLGPIAVTVPGYEILGELGRGGMGVVYKARQVALDRVVALKMILAGSHAGQEALTRFRHEARAVAQLGHPNIVGVHEVGHHEGHAFLVLEYVDGGSLSHRISGSPLPPREAARLLEAIARGVHCAHEHGIIHRDLKPGNILLTTDGVPRVADFGLALEVKGDSRLTATGAILGTPGYMAPEQASQKGIEARTDVWALGAILYEALTGRPPFQASAAYDTMMQTLTKDPVPPRRLNSKVPRDLETVCLKCLQKEPTKRYASAADLADDLHRFLADQPVRARPTGGLERFGRWCRRNPVVASLVGLTQLAFLALVVVALWSNWRIVGALRDSQAEKEKAEWLRDVADNARRDAEGARDAALAGTYRAGFSEARAIRLAGHPGWRWEALNRLRGLLSLKTPARDEPALRAEALVSLGGFDVTPVLQLRGHTQGVWSLCFDRDGRLVSSGQEGTLRVWDIAEGRHVRHWTDRGVKPNLAYSWGAILPAVAARPGRAEVVAANHGGSYWRFEVERGQTGSVLVPERGLPRYATYDAGGQLLALSWTKGVVTIHDAGSGALLRVHELGSIPFHVPIALSRDGGTMVTTDTSFRVTARPVSGGEPRVIGRHREAIRALAASPVADVIASGSEDHLVRLLPLGEGEPLTLVGHTARVNKVAFSPDGELLASVGDDGDLIVWDATSGERLLVINTNLGAVLSVAFSPDGSHLAVGSVDVLIYRLGTRRERRRIVGHRYAVHSVGFHPSKPRMVSGSSDKQILLWDTAAGRPVASALAVRNGPVLEVAMSPDGRLVASTIGVFGSRAAEPDQGIDLWDGDTLAPQGRLAGPTKPVTALAFSPSGRRLAASAGDGLWVWDTHTRQQLGRWDPPAAAHALVLPDEDSLILPGGPGLLWVGLVDGKPSREVKLPAAAARLGPVPGGVVVATADGSVHVLTLPALEGRTIAPPATRPVRGLATSANGDLAAVAGYGPDGNAVHLFDLRKGRFLAALPQRTAVYGVALDPTGIQLAVAGVDERITLWDFGLARPELAALGLDWGGGEAPARAPDAPPQAKLVQGPSPTAPPTATAAIWPPAAGREEEVTAVLAHRVRLGFDARDDSRFLGSAHLARGRYEEARSAFERHLTVCPMCPLASRDIARCDLALDRPADAVAALRRATAAHPANATLCAELALTLLVAGDRPGAVLQARRASSLPAATAAVQAALGEVLYRDGQKTAALEALAGTTDPRGALIRVLALADAGRKEEALAALAAAPGWWRSVGLHPKAVAAWEELRAQAVAAVGADPKSKPDPLQRTALVRLGRWKEALPLLATTDPGLSGRAHTRLGQPEEAAKAFNAVLGKGGPEALPVYQDLMPWGDVLTRLAELRPDDHQLRRSHSHHHATRREWARAAAVLDGLPEAHKLDPDRANLFGLRLLAGEKPAHTAERKTAGAALLAGWTRALTPLPAAEAEEWAAELKKHNLQSRPIYALLLARAQRFTEAVAAARAARGTYPTLALLVEAVARHGLGEEKEARRLWERVEPLLTDGPASRDAALAIPPIEWVAVQVLGREAAELFGRK